MTRSTPGCLGLQNIAGSEAPPPQRTGLGDPDERGPTGGFPAFRSGRATTPSDQGLRNPLLFFLCVSHRTRDHPVGGLSDD